MKVEINISRAANSRNVGSESLSGTVNFFKFRKSSTTAWMCVVELKAHKTIIYSVQINRYWFIWNLGNLFDK